VHSALLGDKIDVFEHDYGRLHRSREFGSLGDVVDAGAGEQHSRRSRGAGEQVANSQRLAGAGRPVEQNAALEVLPGRDQPVPLLTDADDVTHYGLEHAGRQDDGVRCDRRAIEKRYPARAPLVLVAGERHHLSAQHTELEDES
jgi:hypothetical protein